MVAAGFAAEVHLELDLIAQARGGDRFAFDRLAERYQRRVYNVAYKLLGNMQDSLEVSQDALLRAYRNMASLKDDRSFGSWLLRIVTNRALNFRRSRGTAPRIASLDIESDDSSTGGDGVADRACEEPSRKLSAQELLERTRREIASLPVKQRLALVMSTIEELPQKEIAAVMRCSVEAVKWHVFQARKTLRARLGAHV